MAMKKLSEGRRRVIIEGITPQVDCGRFPAKRTLGDQVRVEADLERNYKWLQLWDRVSLEICLQGFAGWEQELPAVPGPAGGQPIRLRMRLEEKIDKQRFGLAAIPGDPVIAG